MASALDLSVPAISKQLAQLKNQGRIRREGPDKGGHWVVEFRVKGTSLWNEPTKLDTTLTVHMENTEGNGGPQADCFDERELFAHCLLIAELIKLKQVSEIIRKLKKIILVWIHGQLTAIHVHIKSVRADGTRDRSLSCQKHSFFVLNANYRKLYVNLPKTWDIWILRDIKI